MLLTASYAMLTVFTKYLDTGFTVAQQVYLRTAVAFALAAVVFARQVRWRVIVRAGAREWTVVVVRTALLYVVGTLLFAKAATMTSVANVSFIAALPLAAALGLLLRQVRATVARLTCVAGSAAGVAIMSGFSPGPGGAWMAWNRGDLIALVAVTAMALSYIGREWHGGVLNNSEITTLTVGVGTVGVALVSVAQGQGLPRLPAELSPVVLWGAIAVAGALSVLNVFLINYGFDRVDSVKAGNLMTVECVWGLLFGLAFYQQIPTMNGLVGGALIVGFAIGLNAAEKGTATGESEELPRAEVKRLTSIDPSAEPPDPRDKVA
ncbi:DMT family transporter [Nocardia sp. CDC159]|uniref:DMT family transporter n=1 Tax=Nocardia pulmonis TaxID=2951408 RepID=A0A9X2E2K9_9NOCA|nr:MULTISPECIES: DMT family transporter [Nocardia]MCM6772491.1 DMT family transporter [Nocardia pulmonis]MCM6784851.1 DMT family transporter [Nocardia sp. CDC159]